MTSIYPIQRGSPSPLGLSAKEGTINFALVAPKAKTLTLHLFEPGQPTPFAMIPFDPTLNRTQGVWHASFTTLPPLFDWGYRIDDGPLFSDPYAKEINASPEWGSPLYQNNPILGRFNARPPFDWGDDKPPNIPTEDLIIYEMHVRGFTKSLKTSHPGSFQALIEKIPYLKKLGVNAVELMPIFEFDECDTPLKSPVPGKKLYNFWGYSTINFFTPMKRFTATADPITEFKNMVKEMHRHGIEVILDVVYNHTAEGGATGKTFSFKGIDPRMYYILSPNGEYHNYSGCGNTLNDNHPVVTKFILDSLRYWAKEMHVDGFRFDLASILTRGESGEPLAHPPVIEQMSQDPLLGRCKLIAEAWDAAGLYQVGHFPSFGRWAEWNGKYRDIVRRFIKGTDGSAGAFAGALFGSQDLYGSSDPSRSINFITAHDGFTLKDLVSYNTKHNEANGEHNQDGCQNNESWNCGEEGKTENPAILRLRLRQMKNLHTALMVSLGIPMILMGDEYGHTREGNNNTWGHDDSLNWFQWEELAKESAFHRFFSALLSFRKKEPLLRRTHFLRPEEVEWHGKNPHKPDWSEKSRFVAYTLKDVKEERHLFIAFNAENGRPTVHLPTPPQNKRWYRVIDTGLNPPHDFEEDPTKEAPVSLSYKMEAYSALVLKAEC